MFLILLILCSLHLSLTDSSYCDLMTIGQKEPETFPNPTCHNSGPGWKGFLDHTKEGRVDNLYKYALNWEHLFMRPECVGKINIYINGFKPQSTHNCERFLFTYLTTVDQFTLSVEFYSNTAINKCISMTVLINNKTNRSTLENSFLSFFTDNDFKNTVIIGGVAGAILVVTIISFFTIQRCKRSKESSKDTVQEDLNDLYGTYYDGPGDTCRNWKIIVVYTIEIANQAELGTML